jgi:hypothetical protein
MPTGLRSGKVDYISESFDTEIPADWTTVNNGTGFGWLWEAGTPFIDSDGAGSSANEAGELISPTVDVTGETMLILAFDQYYNSISPTEIALVEVYDGSAWVTVADYNEDHGTATVYEHVEIDVTAYINTDFAVRFFYDDANNWAWYWYVDNVVVFSPEADDLGADAVSPSGVLSSGSTVTPTVTITNYGSTDQTTYDVTLDDGSGYNETVSNPGTIAAGASLVVDFPDWTPADGTYTLTATVILGGDANPANDVATSEVEVRGIAFGDIVSTFTTFAAGCPGIETDGTNIWTVYWNPAAAGRNFDKYDMNGNFIEEFAISGVSAVRDMAFDPATGYAYGAAATTTIFEMDLANQLLVRSFTGATACRAIAFDDDDVTLWGNNWDTPFAEFDLNGAATGNSLTVPSIYGAAYDNWSDPANPTMWVFQGTGGGDPQWLIEYALDGSATGRTIDLTLVPGFNAGIAGGLASYSDGNAAYLLANLQQDPNLIVKVFLADLGGTTDPEVTFNVDMNTAIMLGDFVPGTDVVYIAGSPWGWAEPGTNAELELLDGDSDGIFSGTYTVTAGDIAYKYFKNAGWDGGEWPGDPNRTYTVTAPVVLNDVWANEYLVTFSVTDGTNAVEGAEIDIESGTETGMTDVDGMAYFGIVDGTYAFTVTMAGYQVFNGSFTVDAANEDVDVVLTVGVNALSSQINVYPNPSNGVFNINVGSSMNLEVFDITGKIINTQVVNGATQMKLDAAGIYFLKFSNPEGSYTMRVVVK